MSSINTQSINANYPQPGVNNNTKGFRDNFTAIKSNLNIARTEIGALESSVTILQNTVDSLQEPDLSETLSSVSGFNTITATSIKSFTDYTPGLRFQFRPIGNNSTSNVTLNVNGRGPKGIKTSDGTSIPINIFSANAWVTVEYNGTDFVLLNNPAFIQSSTGAVSRTVQNKLRERISAFDFMTPAQIASVVARDEIEDVTIPLQNFFDACRGRRGYLPAGTYRKTAQITLDPVHSYDIEGEGWSDGATQQGSIIRDTTVCNGLFIYYSYANFPGGPPGNPDPAKRNNSDNIVKLSKFGLRGPNSTTLPLGTQTIGIEGVPTAVATGTGIWMYWMNNIRIEDVWIDSYVGDGIYGYRCFSAAFKNVWLNNNNRCGIHLVNTANNTSFENVRSLANCKVPGPDINCNILIDGGIENLGPNIHGATDVSYAGQNAIRHRYDKGTLTNINVASGIATATITGTNYYAAGHKIALTGWPGQVVSANRLQAGRQYKIATRSVYPADLGGQPGFVVGVQYTIVTLGTTTQLQWNTIAGTSGVTYSVGSTFTCANGGGAGFGTGTALEFGGTNFMLVGAPNNNVGTIFTATGPTTGNGAAMPDYTVTAGSFQAGAKYTIESLGTTDFTLIGAPSNNIGIVFVATGAGTGTGTASFDLNTYGPVTVTSVTSNTIVFPLQVPNGSYTQPELAPVAGFTNDLRTLQLAPYCAGIGIANTIGAQITAYSEDNTGAGIYIFGNVRGFQVHGGYWLQDKIYVEAGAVGGSIRGCGFMGYEAGVYLENSESATVAENAYVNDFVRGMPRSYIGNLPFLDNGSQIVQGMTVGRGIDRNFGNYAPGPITNTAVGVGTLMNANTSGGIGAGRQCTAVGYFALNAVTSGYNNTAVGRNSGLKLTTGFQNVAVGNRAMDTGENLQDCVFIGHASGSGQTSGSQDTYIGSASGAKGEGVTGASNSNNTGVGSNAMRVSGSQAYQWCTILGAQESVMTAASGLSNYTGIGWNTWSFADTNKVRVGNADVTAAHVQVAWTATSDVRLKKDIKTLDLGVDFLSALRPVSFKRINGDNTEELGFIAQEVETALPRSLGMLQVDTDGTYMLRKDDLIAVLVKSVQELTEKNSVLEARIAKLEKK